ncbi:peptide ABC transporter substrate-binding protein [Agromyces silvae]|uniref:peptide ABC transporter substrate-binding protein n=1 Tax=Agromyces silvae TaxID=3388266 RepID=UPI00280C37EF|nr:peptide ABC transporter substrate-binding protein [Agromyces protaetiae]
MHAISTRTRRRRLGALAGAALSALLVTGCVAGDTDDADGGSTAGGTAVLAMLQEPGSMNPVFSNEGAAVLSTGPVLEPLFTPLADGTYEPLLAAELPSVENGGISEDGLTITFVLREGITWSDGEPLTSEDLVFTWEVINDPESATASRPAYTKVAGITAVDEQTVEVTMTAVNPLYLDLFQSILPAHRFESTTIPINDPLARLPLGTGPFVYGEWRTGDTLELVRNDAYWRDPELPALAGITWKIVADRETAITSLARGEYDGLWWLLAGDVEVLQAEIDGGAPVELLQSDQQGLPEWIWYNHTDPANPTQPHPVLGDLAVREAIDAAIDRESIIETVLKGNAELTGGLINVGQYRCDVPVTEFDPAAANAALDAAGWVPGADGVREKDGVRASLRFTTVSGSQQRVLYQQIIQENLADVGIEVEIANVESTVLFAPFADGGMMATGDFDLLLTLDGLRTPDPSEFVSRFTTASIPSAENPGGFSYTRWSNADYDAAVAAAGATLDTAVAGAEYATACEIFHDERVALPLYAGVDTYAHSLTLADVGIDAWGGMWQNPGIAEWRIAD